MTMTTARGIQRECRWYDADSANVGVRVALPSGSTVMLMRPLVRPAGSWDCAYLDELGRVRMVQDQANAGAHTVTLSAKFLADYGRVVSL